MPCQLRVRRRQHAHDISGEEEEEEGDSHLHPGSGAVIAGEVRSHLVTPLRRRLAELAVGALVVPSRGVLRRGRAGDVEAAVGHTRVDRAGLEDVGVGAHEDVRHHGAGAGAGHEYAVDVSAAADDRG